MMQTIPEDMIIKGISSGGEGLEVTKIVNSFDGNEQINK